MERKTPFVVGEYYHLYTRGVEKRRIVISEPDSERLQLLLLLCNRRQAVRTKDLLRSAQGEPLGNLYPGFGDAASEAWTDIVSYSLMPTHMHLIVRETKHGGISKFMLKLMTAYAMYFNTKYERSGPLFTRPFRSKHVDSDEYFRWLFSYVLLNPLELFQADWKERGVTDVRAAADCMHSYRYGSYRDYYSATRPEGRILNRRALPFDISSLKNFDALLAELAHTDTYQEKSFDAAAKPAALV